MIKVILDGLFFYTRRILYPLMSDFSKQYSHWVVSIIIGHFILFNLLTVNGMFQIYYKSGVSVSVPLGLLFFSVLNLFMYFYFLDSKRYLIIFDNKIFKNSKFRNILSVITCLYYIISVYMFFKVGDEVKW